MFISKEHRPQILSPDCYYSQAQFEAEMDCLFRPAWHCVALASELPREGSYQTLDLLGNPLLLWRKHGEVHAFLNVCAHRFATLTGTACGHAERLRCQYHGWEYDETGNVRKIPDARSFRPLEPGMLGLKKYHAEQCGELVFVSLAENPVPLSEFLGPSYEVCQQWFASDLKPAVVLNREIDANWKVLVENALESYHTAEVHPQTFGRSPPEEACEHRLEPKWTSLRVSYREEQSFRKQLDNFGHFMTGRTPAHEYRHILHYPAVMLSRLSLYRWVECIIPLGPTRSRSVVRLVCDPGRRKWLRWWNGFTVSRWANSFLNQVGAEDFAVMPHVQQGLEAADRPLGGLISTREERIVHFQQFVDQHVGRGNASRPEYGSKQNGKSAARSGSSTESPIKIAENGKPCCSPINQRN